MSDWQMATLQVRGKVRRFVRGSLLREDPEPLLSRRQGDCNRCGACCKILFRCPFLTTDDEGQYSCRIYKMRFSQCRLFPLRAADLAELSEECSYTFEAEPLRPAPNAEPEPALD